MTDKFCVTWKTPRGQFRSWSRYRDHAMMIGKELKSMGALGVEVYNVQRDCVTWSWGEKVDPA